MICRHCREDKLSKEFPFDPLSEKCDHPLLHCLECAVASVKNRHRCSQCDNKVNEDNEIYKEYLETLEFLFPNEEDNNDIGPDSSPSPYLVTYGHITVTTLSGESATFSYTPYKKVLDLKKEIEQSLRTPTQKQRLLYQSTELKTSNQDHKLLTLKDYNVPSNSTLHLIILLFAVPEELEDVVFDFYWGYPHGSYRRDYLDVSVFLYAGSEYLSVVDFRHPISYMCAGVRHSGRAEMDDYRRVGHQKVNVSTKSIPGHIDTLVFTLSAWRSSNISNYPNPRLRFYDAKYPDKQLCSAEMSHAGHNEAIIMCCLSRKDGRWITTEVRKGASGCTKYYSPLREKISSIIRQGFI